MLIFVGYRNLLRYRVVQQSTLPLGRLDGQKNGVKKLPRLPTPPVAKVPFWGPIFLCRARINEISMKNIGPIDDFRT